jgi:NifU-like protein involved in Fe-S cluster formation
LRNLLALCDGSAGQRNLGEDGRHHCALLRYDTTDAAGTNYKNFTHFKALRA